MFSKHASAIRKVRRVIFEDENAACPCCLNTWAFNEDEAWDEMDKDSQYQLLTQGFLLILCSDCLKHPEIKELESSLQSREILYTK